MLPTPMSSRPLAAAIADTSISGALVPKPHHDGAHDDRRHPQHDGQPGRTPHELVGRERQHHETDDREGEAEQHQD